MKAIQRDKRSAKIVESTASSALLDQEILAALDAGIAEANRRERAEFDGLLGQLPEGSSSVLCNIVSMLRDFLLDRYSEADVRALLQEYEPVPGYRNVTPVADDVDLALGIMNLIRSAMRCTDEDPRRPDHFTKLILGGVGVRDKKRQAGTRKERRPDITAWISAQLRRDPRAKSPDLWARAPEYITEQIGQDRFAKRVTACRKRVASK
jgi:hypothetical protein